MLNYGLHHVHIFGLEIQMSLQMDDGTKRKKGLRVHRIYKIGTKKIQYFSVEIVIRRVPKSFITP